MKVLNLYACIGGNRKLWKDVEVTAVEIDPAIAEIYKEHFPNDEVVVGDAHEYLLRNYRRFDFIWASPPCPSHSRIRHMASKKGDYEPIFPDMTLYQEILFLQGFCEGKWVIENVRPYYEPIIRPTVELERHLFWSNFHIPKIEIGGSRGVAHKKIKPTDSIYGFNLDKYEIPDKIKVLRNMVDPEVGQYVFEIAQGIYKAKTTQAKLF